MSKSAPTTYRIADHRYTRELSVPDDHAVLTDGEGTRICALPRPVAETVVREQSLCPRADDRSSQAESEADEDTASDDLLDAARPSRVAARSRHGIDFPADLPWLTASHDPEREHPIWSEQRLRGRIDRFNEGAGGLGLHSDQSKVLKDLVDRGPWRTLGTLDVATFEAEREASSSFRDLFALIDAAHARSPTVPLAPILLLGPAGAGKTYIAQRVAEVLGAPHRIIDMTSLQSNCFFLGSEKHWSETQPGFLYEQLVGGTHANMTVILDEVEKISRNRHHDPMQSLHALLEPENARRLTDLCTDVELDASRVRWILCANSLQPLPATILSRVQVVQVQEPDARERLATTRAVIQSVMATVPGFEPASRELVVALAAMSPRAVRMTVTRALDRARLAGRRRIVDRDLSAESSTEGRVH